MGDTLHMLASDLASIDTVKEGQNIRKTLFKRHGFEMEQKQPEGTIQNISQFEPVGKRVKLGERFENQDDFFVLDN